MGIANAVILAISVLLGFLARKDDYLLALAMAVAGCTLANIAINFATSPHGFLHPSLIARTRYRRAEIRVSLAYLLAIPVDDVHLLVRGHRITTQFQPVGGVFKVYLDSAELFRRFKAKPDSRFAADAKNAQDLRLRLPGKELHKLLAWFQTKREREVLPWRELHEELIESGILRKEDFPYFDCGYLGIRSFPLEFDRYSGCRQLIAAEVYQLRLTPKQLDVLRGLRTALCDKQDQSYYFAERAEIERGGTISGTQATFDIARTAPWLLGG